MLQVSHEKLSPIAILAFEEIGSDVWTGAIAEALEMIGIVRLRAVSRLPSSTRLGHSRRWMRRRWS